MARTTSVDCDGCGEPIAGGTLAHSLQMQVYRRDGSGIVDTLEFSWDDGDPDATPAVPSCGQRAVEALRAEFSEPTLGTTNAGTLNPLLPNGDVVPYFTPLAQPASGTTPIVPGPDPGPAAGG